MGRKRSRILVVEEEDDTHGAPPAAAAAPPARAAEEPPTKKTKKQKTKKKKMKKAPAPEPEEQPRPKQPKAPQQRPVAADETDSSSSAREAAASAQAAAFLGELKPALGKVALGGFAGAVDPRGCDGFKGAPGEPCTRCQRAATLHQLQLEQRPQDLRGPAVLGRTAWLLLKARAALTQHRSFAWCDELLRCAGVCWAVATAPPSRAGKGKKGRGGGGGGGEAGEMMGDRIAAAPAEVARWWRQLAEEGGSGVTDGAIADDGAGMESVVRLLCHIDETWFRLHYFARTEAPTLLASSGIGGAGVPGFAEWMQRAVGATLSSAWLGGTAEAAAQLETRAAALVASAADGRGWSVDLDDAAAAAVLRRGSAAAQLGAAALSQPPRQLGLPAASAAVSSAEPENELLKVYDCMMVETNLLFRQSASLEALGKKQWSALTDADAKTAPDGSRSGLCTACAAPVRKSSKKKSGSSGGSAACCFCGGQACARTCLVTCVGCRESVCLRCRQENYNMDDQGEGYGTDSESSYCPRCAYPVCWPSMAMYRDSIRDPACHLMAYAVPSNESIAALAALKLPLIECGAGTGYWASLLRAAGVTMAAYDIAPNKTAAMLLAAAGRRGGNGSGGGASHNEYHAEVPAWTTVLRGGAEAAAGRDAPFDGARAALFLCYPPPKSPMALQCLRSYKGDVVAYVGEWQGDTATPAFEKALCKDFVCVDRLPLPNWASTAYSLTIWGRRGSSQAKRMLAKSSGGEGEDGLAAMPCAACGKAAKKRCRFCRAVSYCSAECAVAHAPSHRRSHELRGVLLPKGAGNCSSTLVASDVCMHSGA